jgi:hypothetical protein
LKELFRLFLRAKRDYDYETAGAVTHLAKHGIRKNIIPENP